MLSKISEKPIWCLAFDIERSGGLGKHETIGIGASVVDENFNELERLFLPGYFAKTSSEPTVFEQRCWDEFWCKYENQLNELIYPGSLTKHERQHEMITEFQAFRAKWETKANNANVDFYLVSDNSVYDGGFINEMIFEHLPDQMPIPYSASKQEYEAFCDTHSQQKGLLMSIDPSFQSNWATTVE